MPAPWGRIAGRGSGGPSGGPPSSISSQPNGTGRASQSRKAPKSEEVDMKNAKIRGEAAIANPAVRGVDLKLEVVVIPVSDVDRAKQFYGGLGWRLDADLAGDEFHIIQFTPPGSPCSVVFGSGVTPGPYARIELEILEYVGELV